MPPRTLLRAITHKDKQTYILSLHAGIIEPRGRQEQGMLRIASAATASVLLTSTGIKGRRIELLEDHLAMK